MAGRLRRGDTLIQSSTPQRRRVSAVNFTQNQFTVSQLGVIELVDQYTEKYLVAHTILEGRFHTSMSVCYSLSVCLSMSDCLTLALSVTSLITCAQNSFFFSFGGALQLSVFKSVVLNQKLKPIFFNQPSILSNLLSFLFYQFYFMRTTNCVA